MLSHEQAAGHYRRALKALEAQREPDPARRCALLLGLGQRRGALRASGGARDVRARGGAWRGARSARTSWPRRRSGSPGATPRRGSSTATGSRCSRRRWTGSATRRARWPCGCGRRWPTRCTSRPPRSARWRSAGAALEMARRIGDPEALVTALQSRHAALLHISHLDERLALDDEILALAERIGVRELEALGRHWRIYDLLEAGEMAAARAEHEALARLAGRAAPAALRPLRARLGGRVGADERARGRGRAARPRRRTSSASARRPATPTRSTPRSC